MSSEVSGGSSTTTGASGDASRNETATAMGAEEAARRAGLRKVLRLSGTACVTLNNKLSKLGQWARESMSGIETTTMEERERLQEELRGVRQEIVEIRIDGASSGETAAADYSMLLSEMQIMREDIESCKGEIASLRAARVEERERLQGERAPTEWGTASSGVPSTELSGVSHYRLDKGDPLSTYGLTCREF